MEGSKKLVRVALCLTGVCFVFALGDRSAHPQANFKGTQFAKRNTEYQPLESASVSEVDYVDGPLAPLYDFLIQHRLHRFCKLLRDAGLEQVIKDIGDSWTLFAPNDASFIFLPGGTLEELQRNPRLLRDFILYHFIVGDFPSTQIQNELMVDSVQGSPLRFNIYGQTMTVSGAEIVEPDLQFEMGRVYIIDRPLYPIPSEDTMTYLQRNHKEMYKLLVDAGLIDYLSSGTFTILVPDDQAFDYLSIELKDALATNISLAERILLNHILPGSIYVGGITDGMQWDTAGGSLITFTVKRGLTFANGMPIVLPDIPLTNGVIHVINRVLLPDGIEADCQCKPSSESNKTPGQISGGSRSPFVQPQRPPYGQVPTTGRPGQIYPSQTPSPVRGQTHTSAPGVPGIPGTPGLSGTPGLPGNLGVPGTAGSAGRPGSLGIPGFAGRTGLPGTPGSLDSHNAPGQRGYPGRPQSPVSPSVNRPWGPSRSGQPARPLTPPNQITPESPSDDDINRVIETEAEPNLGQRKTEQTRTTRYPPPPPPRQRITPRPQPGVASHTTRRNQAGAFTSSENENYPEQELTTRMPHTTRQVDSWSNRNRTPASRYPQPQRGSYNTPTTRRPQTSRTYDWNQPRFTQPSVEQPDQGVRIDSSTLDQEQGLQTQKPGTQTTSWQQRKQASQITRQPTQGNSFQTTPRQPRPPTSRVTPRPSWQRPATPTQIPSNEQTFEPNQQQPNCRRQGDRITTLTRNLPICSEPLPEGCQNPPYNPSDSRPLCPEPGIQDCRNQNDPFNPSDNRPLCPPSTVSEDCRPVGQPTYTGDRRPPCSPQSVSQSNCKDPSAPYNPSDRRPICRQTNVPQTITPDRRGDTSPQGCRRRNEVANPQDLRPLCPEENEQDCRPLLERPVPGDRRPPCSPPSVSQSDCKDPSAPYNPSDRRPVCRDTNVPQTASPDTRGDTSPRGCRRRDEVANSQDSRPLCPEESEQDCRPLLERPIPGDRRPVCKVSQSNEGSKPIKDINKPPKTVEKPQQQTTISPRNRYPTQTTRRQSWQSTTRAPQSWQTTRQPVGKQPQSGGRQTLPQAENESFQTQPQSGSRPSQPHAGTDIQPENEAGLEPQSGIPSSQQQSDPTYPQSGRYPSQQQTGRYPSQQQSGRYPSQPNSGIHTTQPQRISPPTPPQSGPRPSQPQVGTYPPQRQPSYPSSPGSSQSGSYPNQPPSGVHPSQPQTDSQETETPSSDTYPSQPQSESYPSQQQPEGPSSGVYPQQPQRPGSSFPSPSPPRTDRPHTQPGRRPSQPQTGVQPSRPQTDSSRPSQQGRPSQTSRPSPGYQQRQPSYPQSQSGFTTPSSHSQTQGTSQPGSPGSRPGQPFTPQGRPGLAPVPSPVNRPTTATTRRPISVTGTSTTPGEDSRRTLYEIVEDPALLIRGRPVHLTKIFELFHKAGIEDILNGPGPMTVFLPSDDAFGWLPKGAIEQLEENPELLRQILLYHVTQTEILPSAEPESFTIPSVEGNQLLITMLNGGKLILISGAKAVAVTRANNGIFYVINQLLYPLPQLDIITAIKSRPDLTTLAYLLPLSGLENMLRGQTPYTLLAPTDTAFSQLPQAVYDELTRNTTALQEILLNHIIEGAHYGREFFTGGTFPSARGGKLKFQVVSYGYQVNEVNIKTPEIVTGSGVIHLIDQVLLEEPDLLFITNIENSLAGGDGSISNPEQPNTDTQQPGQRQPAVTGRRPVTDERFTAQRPGVNQPQVGGLQPSPVGRVPVPGQGTSGNQPISPGQPHGAPFGGQRQPTHGQQIPGQSPGSTFSGRQPSTQNVQQPIQGQQIPGQPIRSTFSGRQPSTQGIRQPIQGQQTPGQPISSTFIGRQPTTQGVRQPIQSQQLSGQSPDSTFSGRQPSTQGVRQPIQGQQTPRQPIGSTFGGRQPSTQGVNQPIQGQFQPSRGPLSQPGQQSQGHHTSGQSGHSPYGGQRTQTNSFTNQRSPVTQTISSGNQGLQTDGQPNDVADLARSMGLNKFANWVTNTGLLEKIHDGGVYTVFAPTDDAVSTLPQDMVYSIESNPETVKPILEYHIVPQRLNLNSVTNEETASTLLKGKNIRFNVYKNAQPGCQQLVTASGTPVGDALATMGSIQVIPVTQVLYQPSGNLQKIVEASPILQRLNEAIKSARLTWVLSGTGPMTIFAPSDTAFDSLTEEEKIALVDNKQTFNDLLKRHIIRGTYFSSGIQEDLEKKSENNKPMKLSLQEGILTVNSVPVTYSDITATNGVLHVIDQFL